MATSDHTPTIPQLLCPDCGRAMHQEIQIWKHKPEPTITYTCLTEGCLLRTAATLTADQWITLSTEQLEKYRERTRQYTGKVVLS